MPPGTTSFQVTADGRIVGRDANNDEVAGGQLRLTRFTNPGGLQNIGGGLYIETANTGATVTGTAGSDGFADLQTGRLEGSNVDLAEEMVQMLVAQRTYSSCARTFSIGDEMLRIATDLTQ
jgi:flagellar hook-basal body protein